MPWTNVSKQTEARKAKGTVHEEHGPRSFPSSAVMAAAVLLGGYAEA